MQPIDRVQQRVQSIVVDRVLFVDLPARKRDRRAAGRNERLQRSATQVATIPGTRRGDVATLEQAVSVVLVIGELAGRAFRADRPGIYVGWVGQWPVVVLLATDRIGAVFRQIGRRLERMFVRQVGRVRSDVLAGQQEPVIVRLILCRNCNAVALAIKFLRSILAAQRRVKPGARISQAIRTGGRRCAARRVDRGQRRGVAVARQRVAADGRAALALVGDQRVVTRLEIGDLQAIGATAHTRIGHIA